MGEQIAILAGGCFWCTEAVFLGLTGSNRLKALLGGMWTARPYRQVCGGDNGHAEAIRITSIRH